MPIIGSPPESVVLIATAAEVAGGLTAEEAAEVEDQMLLYQGELESILGRAVVRREHTESILWPMHAERMYLKRGPVESVSSVTIGGLAVGSTDYAVYRDSVEVAVWLATPGLLSVTYVGGWDNPDNLPARNAIVSRTRRWWNRHTDDDEGVEQSAVEGHSVKWSPDAFTEAELLACDRLRNPDLVG